MAIRKNIASSIVAALLGAGFLLYNIQYPLDAFSNPGPGVFPLIVGAVLVILGALQLILDIRKPEQMDCEEKGRGTISIRSLRGCLRKDHAERGILLMIGVFILYLLMVKWVGFFVSTFLFVVVTSRLMGARSWGVPMLLSAGINIFCYFLFAVWLKLFLPRGILF